MTQKDFFKSMFVIICLLLQFNLQAQNVSSITLDVEAGSLKSLLGINANTITDLTLKGNLNGDDIKTIREMTNLSILNLKDVNIVEGGKEYYYNYLTSNNMIGDFMFYGLLKLTNISIPDNIISIGKNAFENCKNLVSINIPNNVSSIEFRTFYGCIGLTNVVIPNSVTTIGEDSFLGCKGLTSIIIPNSVTLIEDYAFEDCISLVNIDIPNSVVSIGSSAFKGCKGLTSIFIPDNVTAIGYSAFKNCIGLTCVTIPNKITEIKYATFENCRGLIEIHCNNPIPPSLGDECFLGVSNCTLYIPKGSASHYKATGWNKFKIIEEEETSINTIKKDNIIIQSSPNSISIEVKEQIPVSVYNISGQKIHESVIMGKMEIYLNKGVYIIRLNNESQKVIVQ